MRSFDFQVFNYYEFLTFFFPHNGIEALEYSPNSICHNSHLTEFHIIELTTALIFMYPNDCSTYSPFHRILIYSNFWIYARIFIYSNYQLLYFSVFLISVWPHFHLIYLPLRFKISSPNKFSSNKSHVILMNTVKK